MLRNNQDHDGFTPPDFIENLLKRNISTTSISTDFRISQYDSFRESSPSHFTLNKKYSEHLAGSSPNIPFTNCENRDSAGKQNYFYESDNMKIWLGKFKIFYKTLFTGQSMQEQQMLEIWDKFENSFQNPFKFDRLVEELRGRKKPLIRIPVPQEVKQIKNCKFKKNLSKSCQKVQKEQTRSLSIPKKNVSCKRRMLEETAYLRKIIEHGHNFIKNSKN